MVAFRFMWRDFTGWGRPVKPAVWFGVPPSGGRDLFVHGEAAQLNAPTCGEFFGIHLRTLALEERAGSEARFGKDF